jgi:hypothetical protein
MTRLGKMARLRREMREEPCKAWFPGINLDGLRNLPAMPPQVLASRPRNQGPASRLDRAGRVSKTRVCRGANQGESNQIKPNQTCGVVGGGCGVDSGQWLVASVRWRKKPAESRPVKPSQTQSNRFDSGSSRNKTILGELLMLVPWPKLQPVGLIKANQTKSNLRRGKKCKFQRFTVQNSMVKTPQFAEKAKQGWSLLHGMYTCAIEIMIIIMKEGIGRRVADRSNAVKPSQTQSNPIKLGQTGSNRIKPNQTCDGEVSMAH